MIFRSRSHLQRTLSIELLVRKSRIASKGCRGQYIQGLGPEGPKFQGQILEELGILDSIFW